MTHDPTVQDLYARLVEMAFAFAASVDAEFGCCHQPEDFRAGFRVVDIDPDELSPLPDNCDGVAILDKWLPEWRQLHGTPAEEFAYVRGATANVIKTVDGVTEDEITDFLEQL